MLTCRFCKRLVFSGGHHCMAEWEQFKSNIGPKHRAEYSRDSNGKDFKARSIHTLHGYIVGSFRPGNPYGKHSPNRSAI